MAKRPSRNRRVIEPIDAEPEDLARTLNEPARRRARLPFGKSGRATAEEAR